MLHHLQLHLAIRQLRMIARTNQAPHKVPAMAVLHCLKVNAQIKGECHIIPRLLHGADEFGVYGFDYGLAPLSGRLLCDRMLAHQHPDCIDDV